MACHSGVCSSCIASSEIPLAFRVTRRRAAGALRANQIPRFSRLTAGNAVPAGVTSPGALPRMPDDNSPSDADAPPPQDGAAADAALPPVAQRLTPAAELEALKPYGGQSGGDGAASDPSRPATDR